MLYFRLSWLDRVCMILLIHVIMMRYVRYWRKLSPQMQSLMPMITAETSSWDSNVHSPAKAKTSTSNQQHTRWGSHQNTQFLIFHEYLISWIVWYAILSLSHFYCVSIPSVPTADTPSMPWILTWFHESSAYFPYIFVFFPHHLLSCLPCICSVWWGYFHSWHNLYNMGQSELRTHCFLTHSSLLQHSGRSDPYRNCRSSVWYRRCYGIVLSFFVTETKVFELEIPVDPGTQTI